MIDIFRIINIRRFDRFPVLLFQEAVIHHPVDRNIGPILQDGMQEFLDLKNNTSLWCRQNKAAPKGSVQNFPKLLFLRMGIFLFPWPSGHGAHQMQDDRMFHRLLDLFQRGIRIRIQLIQLIRLLCAKDVKATVQIEADRQHGDVSPEDHIHQILLAQVILRPSLMNMIDQLLLALIVDPCLLIEQNDPGIEIGIIRGEPHHRFIGIQGAVIRGCQIIAPEIKRTELIQRPFHDRIRIQLKDAVRL